MLDLPENSNLSEKRAGEEMATGPFVDKSFLRTQASPRAPPPTKQPLPPAPSQFKLVPVGESLEVQFPETKAEASRKLPLVLDLESR
ncbi:MAG: hypothetical protein OSA89_16335 [Mariniblastus sp.]|nr:hypothetical protein [Mariniblastus sp.]